MHRTVSLDYGVVLAGEILLGTEDGKEVRIRTGEVIIQRGTMHSWRNDGDVTCRILFVMLGADKVVVEKDGSVLDEALPRPPGAPGANFQRKPSSSTS
jgi:quercetin dioxygenase-like cupin family protein